MPVASQSLLICNGCCFVHELVKTFHLAFFLGCLGVALFSLNPISAASSLNSFELNGGPSLGCTVFGTPCVVKIFFSFFRTGLIYIALMIELLGILSIGLLSLLRSPCWERVHKNLPPLFLMVSQVTLSS